MVFCAWPRESNGEEQCWGKGVTARFFITKLDSEILICVEKKSFLQNFHYGRMTTIKKPIDHHFSSNVNFLFTYCIGLRHLRDYVFKNIQSVGIY